jgi:hypothetical protein
VGLLVFTRGINNTLMGPRLDRAVASMDKRGLLGPTETRHWIAGRPDVAAQLRSARRKILEAEQAGLHMDRDRAINAGREAIRRLSSVYARLHRPRLVGRANVALGLALLLRPADPTGAAAAFADAVAADPDLRPDPYRMPSRAQRLLAEARRQTRRGPPPSATAQLWLTRVSRLDYLVAVELTPHDGGSRMRMVVVSGADRRVIRRQQRTFRGERVADRIVDAVTAAMRQLVVSPVPGARREPESQGRPWYRSWWTWTLVGAALIGTGAGLAVGLRRDDEPQPGPPPDSFKVHFHF